MIELLNNKFFYSLGMTVLHSIWQILAIFLIVYVIIVALKKVKPLFKYYLLCISLLFVIFISGFTFSYYYHAEDISTEIYLNEDQIFEAESRISPIKTENTETSKISTVSSLLPDIELYIPWVVGLYILGLLVLSLRLLYNLYFLRRLKHVGVFETDENLEKLFRKIKTQILPSDKLIKIIESALIKVPVVIGYFKPVVIVPAGIFTNLPFNQVEAILAHELAHIKRKDFLINILQSVVEILFFYHPLIYLISRRIRSEREKCCDDIALNYCSNTHYAKALANMEQLKLVKSYPAVAFAESGNELLIRIRRILKQEKMKTKFTEKLFAGIIVLAGVFTITLLGSAAFSRNEINVENEFKPSYEEEVFTLPSGNFVIDDTIKEIGENDYHFTIKDDNGEEFSYKMKFENSEVSELYVNGELIPKKDYPKHKKFIKSALKDVQKARQELANIDQEKIEMEIQESIKVASEINMEEIQKEIEQARFEYQEELANINMDSIREALNQAQKEIQFALSDEEMEKINQEIEGARIEFEMEMKDFDLEEFQKQIEMALEEIDMEEIQEAVKKAQLEYQVVIKDLNIDIQGITEDAIMQAQKAIESINFDSLNIEMEEIKIEIEKENQKLEEAEKSLQKTLDQM